MVDEVALEVVGDGNDCLEDARSAARAISSRSAPKVSGISVRIAEPPEPTTRSHMRPTSGLAVRPENRPIRRISTPAPAPTAAPLRALLA